MLTQEDFTSNEVIDSIQIGDTTVDIVGFVVKVSNNCHSKSGAIFYKLVVDNAQGRQVQVIAWNHNIPLLDSIQQMGTIVHVSTTKASAIRNSMYNSGNVSFELLMKKNSKIVAYGEFDDSHTSSSEQVKISEIPQKINKKIKVEGIMKTEFNVFKNQNISYTVGSITDIVHKLELKCHFDCSQLELKKGDSVEIIGIVEQNSPTQPILTVSNIKHIKKLKRDRIPFTEVLNGFKIFDC